MARRSEDPAVQSIIDLARHYEPDRYVAALLVPAAIRDDLLALAAFAGDVTKIRLEVREPALAQIRLQWWRDALSDHATGQSSGHPVMQALSTAIIRHDIAPDLIDDCLAAAQQAMAYAGDHHDPVWLGCSADAVSELARAEAILFQLAAAMLSKHGDMQPASDPLATACALAGNSYARARLVFEQSIKIQSNQSVDGDSAMRNLIGVARQKARLAKAARRGFGSDLAPAFHPLALVEPYLRMSEHRYERIRHARIATLPLYRMWRIGRAHLGKLY